MRIYGNRQLKTLPGKATRPTAAKVRSALFNIWQGSMEQCRWLDLCAGNGSIGAEALCRGAMVVVGIEKSGRACSVIKQNWQQVAQPQQHFQVIRGDVLQRIKNLKGESFSYIYFDPPYASQLYQPVLSAIAHYQLLELGGEIAVEHDPKQWEALPIANLEICRQKRYGKSSLSFYSISSS